MSTHHPAHDVTAPLRTPSMAATTAASPRTATPAFVPPGPPRPRTDNQHFSHVDPADHPHDAAGAFVTSVLARLEESRKWTAWQAVEPRLAGFTSLEDARAGWRRRDGRCYQVVAGLTALGSRRGGDDDDAALAVAALLEDGVNRLARTLSDVCELADVNATVWEEVKAAEPSLGNRAARYLLQRSRQRLTRPAAGMIPRVPASSLDQRLGWGTHGTATAEDPSRDPLLAAPDAEDPVNDLADLLRWAAQVGVIAREEVDLLVELLAAENDGMAREEAQRAVGQRHGVSLRTIRRRRERTAARLRDAAPQYLMAIG